MGRGARHLLKLSRGTSFVQRLWLVGVAAALALSLLAVAAPAGAAATAASRHVSVPANRWIETGIRVTAGDIIRVTASGSWTDGSTTSGPNGATVSWPDNFFNLADLGACADCATTKVPEWGALIGYIGSAPPAAGSYSSTAVLPQALKIFYIGGNYEAEATHSGELWLGKNADAYSGYIVDNSGRVNANVTVLPPESARQIYDRAKAAALSARPGTPLGQPVATEMGPATSAAASVADETQQAETVCGMAVLQAWASDRIQGILEKLIPGEAVSDIFEGATISGDVVTINYDLGGGQIGQATFDLGKLVFDVLGDLPGLSLFGVVGDPAIDCTEAGFLLTGQLGGQLGAWLRARFKPPAMAGASLAGSWKLTRSTLACVHLDFCDAPPLHLTFSHCTEARCTMSAAQADWPRNAIVRHGSTWTASFTNPALVCGSQQNDVRTVVKLSVTTAHQKNNTETARSLGGTLVATAAQNPPNCPGDVRIVLALHGGR